MIVTPSSVIIGPVIIVMINGTRSGGSDSEDAEGQQDQAQFLHFFRLQVVTGLSPTSEKPSRLSRVYTPSYRRYLFGEPPVTRKIKGRYYPNG
jgi:hypothetical protein